MASTEHNSDSSTPLSSLSQPQISSTNSDNNKKEIFESASHPSSLTHPSPAAGNDSVSSSQQPRDPMIIDSNEHHKDTQAAPISIGGPTNGTPSNTSQPANTPLPSNSTITPPPITSNTSTDSIVEYNSRRELENYYNNPLRGSRGALDPTALSLPDRRLAYLDEAITYNVYVGGLGEEVDENDLFHYFSPCGPIDSCRVFRSKDEPFNKYAHPSLCPDVGYGFVHFITPEGQAKALSKDFNRPKIKNSCGYTKIAVEKTTLFIGGLPISMKESEVSEMFRNSYINFRTLILKTGPPPNCTSRGFCFLSFDTHKAAEAARQLLVSGPVHGKMLTVGWAEPQGEDEDDMDKVTTLFINNLASHIIDEQLKALFSPYGEILKCRVVRHLQTLESRGFAFVEYAERDACVAAMNKLNGTDFFGEKLTVTLARPLDYRNRVGPTRGFPPTTPGAVGAGRGRGARDKMFPPPYPPFYPYPPAYPPPPPHYRYNPYSRPYHPGYDYSYYSGHYDSYGYGGYYDSAYSAYYYGAEYPKGVEGAHAAERAAIHSPQAHAPAARTAEEAKGDASAYNYGYYGDSANYWQQYQNYPAQTSGYSNYPAQHPYGAYPNNYHYPAENGANAASETHLTPTPSRSPTSSLSSPSATPGVPAPARLSESPSAPHPMSVDTPQIVPTPSANPPSPIPNQPAPIQPSALAVTQSAAPLDAQAAQPAQSTLSQSTHPHPLQNQPLQFQTQNQFTLPPPSQNQPLQFESSQNQPVPAQNQPENQPAQLQPAQHQPAQLPPAQLPPAQLPPAQLPPAQLPPAQLPPAQLPPAQLQPAQLQPAQLQPAQLPPAQQQPLQQLPAQHQPVHQLAQPQLVQLPSQNQPVPQQPLQHLPQQPTQPLPHPEQLQPLQHSAQPPQPLHTQPVHAQPQSTQHEPAQYQPAQQAQHQPAQHQLAQHPPAQHPPAQPAQNEPAAQQQPVPATPLAQPLQVESPPASADSHPVRPQPTSPSAVDIPLHILHRLPPPPPPRRPAPAPKVSAQ